MTPAAGSRASRTRSALCAALRASAFPPRGEALVRAFPLIVLALVLAACGGAPASSAKIMSITLSRGLAPDYSPLAPTERFAPHEAFYCAVLVTGLQPNMVVSARWLYGEQLVKRTDYVVRQTGDGYVGFELTNDHPPWPSGAYRVEILVNHELRGSQAFSVP